jgi:hypothetical protein
VTWLFIPVLSLDFCVGDLLDFYLFLKNVPSCSSKCSVFRRVKDVLNLAFNFYIARVSVMI